MAITDSYGNVYSNNVVLTQPSTANVIYTTTGSNTLNLNLGGGGGGGGGGGKYNIYAGTAVPNMYSTAVINYNPPNVSEWLTMPGMIDTVIEQLTTRVKDDEKVVVCVDDDMSWEQVKEIQTGLKENKLTGVVIRGARAGTGYAGGYIPPTPEEARVDVLARIGEIWALNPSLRLTDLLQWYDGQDMTNEEFATSVEVHFQKITNGAYGKPS
jgi:hypothetical protein